MTYYRLYFLDARGHIRQFREFEAITDAAATAQSEQWRDSRAMELWSGRRKVKRWDALALSPEAVAGFTPAAALRNETPLISGQCDSK